jgi:hypothetical protein
MCYTGYNVEDAVLINEASIKRGLFNTTYYSCYETHEEKSVTNESTIETLFQNIEDTDNLVGKKLGHDYSKLNKYGIINENELVDEKSIIIGIVSNNSEDKDKKFDLSKKPKKGQIGFVDKSFISENDAGQRIAKVKIREFRTPKIGDKMGSRCGQKGTVGLIIPERDMPFNKDGQKPDMIINPHAIPSRMTIGQLIETITGKSGLMRGGFIDSTAFITKNNKFNLFAELLVKDGFHSSGTELFYNGFTGQQISSEIFVGPTYYMRLKHMVKDKINFRSFGKNAKLTKQPVSGRANDGGLRIGEMERDVLISHGTSNFLTESMMERGDKYYMAVCNKSGMIAAYNEDTDIYYSLLSDGPMEFTNITKFDCDMIQKTKFGRDFSIVRIPYTFKLLIQELGACNIQIRVITQDNINNIEDLSYSKNINKLLDIDNNVPMENVLNHIINENNKKNNARVNDNKFTKPTKDDEAYRNNPYIVSYLEKFPDDSIEDALNDYNNFLLNGQGKLYIDEELIKLGWTQQYSETKNKTYWFNTNTGESSWTKPIVKTEIPVIEDDDESVPWAPDEDFDSINTVDSNKSSIPYATEEIERMNIENTDSKFKLNDNVHLRGDSKQTRIWVIKNIADKFITIITDDNEGLISDEMTRVITEPEIFKVDDYSYNLPETLGGKSAPVPDMQNNMPVVNIAPVFKIVNGDNAENNAATEEVPIIDNNGLTNTSDLMNFKPTLDSNVTQEQEPQEITDKSKIDFNKLVIKKV